MYLKPKRIAIAYDNGPDNLRMALAVRGMLEFFGLSVSLKWLNEVEDVHEFLSQMQCKFDCTILCAHGIAEGNVIWLQVLKPSEGRPGQYIEEHINLTPDIIRESCEHKSGIFITTACDAGCDPFACAFLDAGYEAYIGPTVAVDVTSSVIFICGLFSNLLAGRRDIHKANYSLQESVSLAAGIQPFPDGTEAYRLFQRPLG